MMYVSRAVRSIRDHPVPDATVTRLLEVETGAETPAVRQSLDALEGADRLGSRPYDTLRVRVQHDRVGAVCEIEGLAAVETEGTLVVDAGGAGEDVDF